MSIEAMAMVLNHSRLSGTDKLVLLGIANHEGDGGSWPSITTLARYANVEVRAVQRAIGRLVVDGELEVGRQCGNPFARHRGLHTNLYRVLITCPAECDRSTYHRLSTGVSSTTPVVIHRGDVYDQTGVSSTTPKTSLNHPKRQRLQPVDNSDRERPPRPSSSFDATIEIAAEAITDQRNDVGDKAKYLRGVTKTLRGERSEFINDHLAAGDEPVAIAALLADSRTSAQMAARRLGYVKEA